MIVFDLHCSTGHRFEGWFGSSADYEGQQEQGLVCCPTCGTSDVSKAPMAPAIPRKGNSSVQKIEAETAHLASGAVTPEVEKALKALAKAQAEALKSSTYVGDDFAEQSRAMHYGERDQTAIHGKASLAEAKELLDEGIAVSPLPFPLADRDELN